MQGWEDKPVASVDPLVPRGTQHILLKGTSVVELREHGVVIDKPHPELGSEIPFEYCILATVSPFSSRPSLDESEPSVAASLTRLPEQGSDYPWPCRPRKGASIDEITSDFRTLQAQVESSSSILVVGGGPVGIEFAGEVAAHYNGKSGRAKKQEITIVHAQESYLTEPGWKDGFNSSIRNQLDSLGVKTIFGAKVEGIPDTTGKVEGGKRDFALSNGQTVTGSSVPSSEPLSAFIDELPLIPQPTSSFSPSATLPTLTSSKRLTHKPSTPRTSSSKSRRRSGSNGIPTCLRSATLPTLPRARSMPMPR